MDFIYKLVIYIAINLILNYVFADDGPDIQEPKPGTVKIPTVTASDTIPVLFGTSIIGRPNVVWYGDVSSMPWRKCT